MCNSLKRFYEEVNLFDDDINNQMISKKRKKNHENDNYGHKININSKKQIELEKDNLIIDEIFNIEESLKEIIYRSCYDQSNSYDSLNILKNDNDILLLFNKEQTDCVISNLNQNLNICESSLELEDKKIENYDLEYLKNLDYLFNNEQDLSKQAENNLDIYNFKNDFKVDHAKNYQYDNFFFES